MNYFIAILMRTSLKCLSAGTGYTPSQQELNDLRGVVTNLGGELTSQAESYWLLMEKYKQLEQSTPSNRQLSQQMMIIDQRLQAFFQMQQTSGSGSLIIWNIMRMRKRKGKRMILTLVIGLVAIFPQLVALLLDSSWSTYLPTYFP